MRGGRTEGTPVRLRVIAEAAPPEEYDGRLTEFGLQDRQRVLHFGAAREDGSRVFECEVTARRNTTTGAVRFSGPFVHGTPAEPFLYLSWKYVGDPPEWIRRQKIPLAALPGEAFGHEACFQGTVPAITVAAATVPVEWTPADG